jgi:hypothetical protein
LCKVRGIKNYSKKRKNELINLLTNLEVIPVVDVVKKSSTSFKSGKLYQDRIFNILTTIQINSKQGIVSQVDGAKSGPDIVYDIDGKKIGFEIKNKGAFEGGSCKMIYDTTGQRLVFNKSTLHSDVLGDKVIYEGKNLPWYDGIKTKPEYVKLKHIFGTE